MLAHAAMIAFGMCLWFWTSPRRVGQLYLSFIISTFGGGRDEKKKPNESKKLGDGKRQIKIRWGGSQKKKTPKKK